MKRMATAFCLVLAATAALADGDGPSRKMTAAEAAAYAALKGAIQAALPPPPANYSLAFGDGSGPGGPAVPEALQAAGALRMSFTATYTLSRDFAAGQQQNLFLDRAKGTPGQQARLAALEAKDAELTRARDAARDRGEKDRIRAELKAVRDESNALQDQVMADYQAWVASGGAVAAMQGAEQSLPAKELAVRVLVNQDVSLSEKAVPYGLPGFPLAFEQAEGCQLHGGSCVTVLVGGLAKERKAGSHWLYRLRAADLGVPTKPRGMALVVEGPRQQPQAARELLGKIDLAKLKALVP